MVRKFLQHQNWKYGIPCAMLLTLFAALHSHWGLQYFFEYYHLNWLFLFGASFLVFYCFKFSEKENKLLIDHLKLVFFFCYIAASVFFTYEPPIRRGIQWAFPWFLLHLYFYSALLSHKKDMENKNQSIRRSYWIMILSLQSFLFLGIIVYAITQKVEAERQKVLALYAEDYAKKAKEEAEKAKEYAEKQKEITEQMKMIAIQQKDESLMAREEAEKNKLISLETKELALKERDHLDRKTIELNEAKALAKFYQEAYEKLRDEKLKNEKN